LSGSKLVFSYCPLDKAIALLRGQYAVGMLDLPEHIFKVESNMVTFKLNV